MISLNSQVLFNTTEIAKIDQGQLLLKMPEAKWKSPLVDWDVNNQESNIVFSLVAQNERTRQMWADPHNSSLYIPASFTRSISGDQTTPKDSASKLHLGHSDGSPRPKKRVDTEPTLQFKFNHYPKNFAKGYVLGSDEKRCDALLGDPGDVISEQMLAFTFNEQHQVIMNVTSDKSISVTFNDQKKASRKRFSWIFPREQKLIHVVVADVLAFDVVLPKYGAHEAEFHRRCESFLSSVAHGHPRTDSIDIINDASDPLEPFYLQQKHLGSGSYGSVYKVLQMPEGKDFAAKEFEIDLKTSFKKEVRILKKVCQTYHVSIRSMPC